VTADPSAVASTVAASAAARIAAPESFEDGLCKLGARIELAKRFAGKRIDDRQRIPFVAK